MKSLHSKILTMNCHFHGIKKYKEKGEYYIEIIYYKEEIGQEIC